MESENVIVVDLVVPGQPRRQPVEQRVERRLAVLREWLRDGIPFGKNVPESLTDARQWNDPEMGIAPIASPNEFTQKHPILGERVREIAGLLTALRNRYDPPKGGRARPGKGADAVAVFDRKAHERQLQAAVSQWHAERDRSLTETKRAESAEARSVALLEENAGKDKLIADLRRQLSRREGLSVVK